MGLLKGDEKSEENFQFMRKGVAGSSKEELTEELSKKLDEWEEFNLKKAGVTREELYGV